jgi:hypothetical protein
MIPRYSDSKRISSSSPQEIDSKCFAELFEGVAENANSGYSRSTYAAALAAGNVFLIAETLWVLPVHIANSNT